jgi:uncharacterized surface protein with fasciclin (FAS1) repeats
LRRTLKSSGTFTLFLPNDEAFRELRELDSCGAIELNEQVLSTLLNYDVVRGSTEAAGPGDQRRVRTRLGAPITIASEEIHDGSGAAANIDGPAIEAANGVAHVIDKVLWPYPVPVCS